MIRSVLYFPYKLSLPPPIDSLPFKEEQTDLSKQLSYISRTGAPQYKRYYNSEWPLEYAYFNWSEQARSPSLATNPDRSIPMTNFNYGIQRELQNGSIIWFVPEVDPTDCMQGNKLALYKSDPLPKQPSKDLHNESWQQGFNTIKSDGRGRIFELIQVITSDKPIYSVAVAQSPVIVEDKEGKQVYPRVIGDKEKERIGHLGQSLEVKTNYANLTARLARNNELPTQIPMFAISHSAAHTNTWATLFHPVEDQPEILLHKTSSSTLTYPHRHSVEQWQQFLYHSASKSTSLKFLAGVTSLGAFIFKQRLLGSGSANPQTSTVPTP